jgi:hypothetical protein
MKAQYDFPCSYWTETLLPLEIILLTENMLLHQQNCYVRAVMAEIFFRCSVFWLWAESKSGAVQNEEETGTRELALWLYGNSENGECKRKPNGAFQTEKLGMNTACLFLNVLLQQCEWHT